MSLNLQICSLIILTFTAENRKKNSYEKLRYPVKLVFDGLALGNYIINNRAKSKRFIVTRSIETLKDLTFVQWSQ